MERNVLMGAMSQALERFREAVIIRIMESDDWY